MARRMSPEREREFEELHAFIDYFSTHVWRIDPQDPAHPTNVGRRVAAEIGRSKALEGLRQAVNDTVEALSDRPPEFVSQLDAALGSRGIVTLSEIRRRFSSSYRRILQRGRIMSETEYYLVAGVLADLSLLATTEERELLERLVADFSSESGRA